MPQGLVVISGNDANGRGIGRNKLKNPKKNLKTETFIVE